MPDFTAVIRERANIYELPQTGPWIDAGARIWDLRHPRFAGGIPTDGVTDCRAALMSVLNYPEVRRPYLPEGTYVFAGEPWEISGLAAAGIHIDGAGRERTRLRYTPPNDATRRAAILINGVDGVRITGIEVEHLGARSVDRQRQAGTAYANVVHGYCIELRNCNDTIVEDVMVGPSGGTYGIYLNNTIDIDPVLQDSGDYLSFEWTTNRNNSVRHCHCVGSYNAGIYCRHADVVNLHDNFTEWCGYDGLKMEAYNRSFSVSRHRSAHNGRDGADFHPAGFGGQVSHFTAWDNSGMGAELKGLYFPEVAEYGLRETVFSDLLGWGNGVGGSWSIEVGRELPNFSLVSLRSCTINGLVSISPSGVGVQLTDCQGLTCADWLISRTPLQGLSLHSTYFCLFPNLNIFDPGYVPGVVPAAPGTHDAITFGAGSGFNVISGQAQNSPVNPGGMRYGASFDAVGVSGNLFRDFSVRGALSGGFGSGVATEVAGLITISAPFDAAAPFDTQVITSYRTAAFQGVQMLGATRPGVRVVGGNAEFMLARQAVAGGVHVSDMLLQVQAALARIMTLVDVPLQLGTNGTAWLEVDHDGNLCPLQEDVLPQKCGTIEHPWTEVHALEFQSGTASWKAINGSPEGVETDVVGSLRSRLDGGAGTVLYVKESSPLPNTGWVPFGGAHVKSAYMVGAVALAVSSTVALPELGFAVKAGEVYEVEWFLKVTVSGGAAGVKPKLVVPAGTVGFHVAQGTSSAATNTTQSTLTPNLAVESSVGFVTASFLGWVRVTATLEITTDGTAGLSVVTGAGAVGSVDAYSRVRAVRVKTP